MIPRHQPPPRRRISSMSARECCLASTDFLFDMFTLVINLADVVSDIAICISWYQKAIYEFFWLSIALFFVSQVAYTVLFVVIYGGNLPNRYFKMLFILIFPFAQIVPFFIWFQSYHWQWLDSIVEWLGLDPVTEREVRHEDPLMRYIMSKVRVHGGFIIESLFESVPQSIIQLIAMVMHRDTSVLATFSIITSIISICSRGFIISYSIHRPTFAFNMICVVTDVVGLFCVASWLFLVDPNVLTQYSIPFFPDIRVGSWWSLLWIELFLLLGASIVFLCLLVAIISVWEGVRLVGEVLLLGLFATIMFPVGLVMLQGFNLTALPIFVFQSLGSSRAAVFQGLLAAFLDEATTRHDLEERSTFASLYFARLHLQNLGLQQNNGWAPPLGRSYLLMWDSYVKARALCMGEPVPFRYYYLASGCGTFMDHDKENRVLAMISLFTFFPALIASSCYGVVFPFICIITTPWEQSTILQRGLTFIVISAILALAMLFPFVYRFQKRTGSVDLFHHSATVRDLEFIRQELRNTRRVRSACNWGQVATLIASHRAVDDPTMAIHTFALLPDITQFLQPTRQSHFVPTRGPPAVFPINKFFQSQWFRGLLPHFIHPSPPNDYSTSILFNSDDDLDGGDSNRALLSQSTRAGYGTC